MKKDIRLKKDKILCPIRLDKNDYAKLKIKCHEHRIAYQKLVEVLVLHFLKGNKEIIKLVNKYVEEHATSKQRRGSLDEIEIDNLLNYIEQNESPLNKFNLPRLAKELEDETDDEEEKTL